MTRMGRFWFPFRDAARRSPWATLGGIVTTALSLAGVTLPSLVGLPSWAVFVVMLVAVFLASIVVYHVASLAWTAQEEDLRTLREQQPRVELGEPQLQPDGVLKRTQLSAPLQTSTGPAGPQYRVQGEQRRIRNYQIPIANHGAPAREVQVNIVGISPSVDGVSKEITLHMVTDDPPLDKYTFKRSFSLATRQTEWVDVVAMDKQDPKTCYLWNVAFEDAVQGVRLGGTHMFTIRAYAGDAPVEARYEVYADSLEARLEMKGPLPPL